MSNLPIFDVAGSALQAQSVRLNTIASNLSNADSIASSPEAVYKPIEPIFQARPLNADGSLTSVQVKEITQSEAPPIKRYEPGHPMADGDGYVYAPDVDPVAQMVNLISASRGYQAGVEVLNTAKELALAANTGTRTDKDRQAYAAELSQIQQQVLGLMNSKDANGNYLFSGSKTDTAPYSQNADGTYTVTLAATDAAPLPCSAKWLSWANMQAKNRTGWPC